MSQTAPTKLTPRGVWVAGAVACVGVIALALIISALLGDGPRHHHRHRPSGPTSPVQVYFQAASPTGVRLYAEPHDVAGTGDDRVLAAVRALTARHGPDDPDYRTVWPAHSFSAASVEKDRIVIGLTAKATKRPRGVTAAEATIGLQQLAFTADAASDTNLPVEIVSPGSTTSSPLGISTGPIVRDQSLGLFAPVNLSHLADGARVSGTLTTGGTLTQDVHRIRWTLSDHRHQPVRHGSAKIMGGSFTLEADLKGLPAGTYVLTVRGRATGQTSGASRNYSDSRNVQVS
ncbi:hypothetical protein [Nocardioides montaniterrae]